MCRSRWCDFRETKFVKRRTDGGCALTRLLLTDRQDLEAAKAHERRAEEGLRTRQPASQRHRNPRRTLLPLLPFPDVSVAVEHQ